MHRLFLITHSMRKITKSEIPGEPADLKSSDLDLFILPSCKAAFDFVNQWGEKMEDYLDFKKYAYQSCGFEISRELLPRFYDEVYNEDPLRLNKWQMEFYPDHSIFVQPLNLGFVTRKEWAITKFPSLRNWKPTFFHTEPAIL